MQTGDVIGPWRLVRRLGAGGMGSVWEAVPLDGGAPVALKLMLEPRASSVHRFFDEARRGQALAHHHVVRVHDFGQHGEQVWLSMELLTGRTLASLLAVQREPLPLGLVAALSAQALSGLEAVHRCFVHRDVKPSNLVLTAAGVLKLIDFGIALGGLEDGTLTRTGTLRGSLPYIAPEQAYAEPLDARADLFSFGLVMHELLTGTRVFNQTSDAAILTALLMQPIPSPRARRPGLPAALDALVMRALARDPDERYATAAEMAQALEACGLEEAPWEEERVATWLATQPERAALATPGTASLDAAPGAPVGTASKMPAEAVEKVRRAKPDVPVRVAKPRWAVPLLVVAALLAAAAAGGLQLARRSSVPGPTPLPVGVVAATPAPQPVQTSEAELLTPPGAPASLEPRPSSEPSVLRQEPGAAGAAREVTAPRHRATGFLTVDARPSYGRVSVDGKPVGLTPLARLVVGEGRHVVEVTRDDGISRRKSLRVRSGAEERWVVIW